MLFCKKDIVLGFQGLQSTDLTPIEQLWHLGHYNRYIYLSTYKNQLLITKYLSSIILEKGFKLHKINPPQKNSIIRHI